MYKQHMKFLFLVPCFSVLLYCKPSNKRKDIGEGMVSYSINLGGGKSGLGLSSTGGTTAIISKVIGTFEYCKERNWEVPGSVGTVVAPLSCGSLVYGTVNFTIDQTTYSVSANGDPIKLPNGDVWSFAVSEDNASAALKATNEMGATQDIVIESKKSGVDVSMTEISGPICHKENPFTITQGMGKVTIQANLATGVNADDLTLVASTESYVTAISKTAVEVDISKIILGVNEVKSPILLTKGESTCELKALKLEMKSPDTQYKLVMGLAQLGKAVFDISISNDMTRPEIAAEITRAAGGNVIVIYEEANKRYVFQVMKNAANPSDPYARCVSIGATHSQPGGVNTTCIVDADSSESTINSLIGLTPTLGEGYNGWVSTSSYTVNGATLADY